MITSAGTPFRAPNAPARGCIRGTACGRLCVHRVVENSTTPAEWSKRFSLSPLQQNQCQSRKNCKTAGICTVFSKLVPRHVAPKQRLVPPRHHVLPLWHLNIRDVARNVQSPRANAVRGSLSLYTGCISDHFQPAATLAINMPTEENAATPSL